MKSPVQSIFVCGVAAVVVLALTALGERAWAAHRARAALQETEGTLSTLAASRPAPGDSGAAEVQADLAHATNALREARAATARHRAALAELDRVAVPANSPEAYFDLARFRERMRTKAGQRQIALAAEERFGFATFAQAGPPAPAIARVFRQRLLAEQLLEAVFAAEPRELVLFEREPVAGETIGERSAAPSEHTAAPTLFRVGFTGETGTLRSLLNALATSELPWVTRQVEVESALASLIPAPTDPPAAEVLVRRGLSRFVVTVECIAPPPMTPACPEEQPETSLLSTNPIRAPAASWNAPGAQRRGDDWTYEIFTPPEIRYESTSDRLSIVRSRGTPMPEMPVAVDVDGGFRLTLKRIEPVPFRLQLVGFAGSREAPRGVFENVSSGEMLLLGSQSQIASLAITVEQVRVERHMETDAGGSTQPRMVATATVRDERTGARVTLTTWSRSFTEELVAVVASATPDSVTQSVRAGDLIREGPVMYRIDKIQLAPAAVRVTKLGAGQRAPESRTLVLQPELVAEQSSGSL